MNSTQEKKQNEYKMTRGGIVRLGDHILICGDATMKFSQMSELILEEKIRMILTDPPYGVAYVENKNWAEVRGGEKQKHVKIKGDQLQSDEEYANFTAKWIQAILPVMTDYNSFYIFNSDLMICALREGMKRASVKYSQMIIWIKNSVVLGRKDYNPQHELIAYGWYGKHKFERGKSRSVMFYPKPHKSTIHPTMKPIGLLRRLILDNTKIGEWVYDPFGGSGSTLIACEHTRRKCLMVESDPEYCESIINRWEALTNKKAKEYAVENSKVATATSQGDATPRASVKERKKTKE